VRAVRELAPALQELLALAGVAAGADDAGSPPSAQALLAATATAPVAAARAGGVAHDERMEAMLERYSALLVERVAAKLKQAKQ
jgi:hypothetical protein